MKRCPNCTQMHNDAPGLPHDPECNQCHSARMEARYQRDMMIDRNGLLKQEAVDEARARQPKADDRGEIEGQPGSVPPLVGSPI